MANEDPVEKRFRATRAELTYYERGRPGDPVLLLLHATGFHARCWDSVIRRLKKPWHSLAVDLRCHGKSEKTGLLTDWTDHAADIHDLVNALDLKDITAVGHSMGGYCAAYTAGRNPERFRRLLLVDPVMMDPALYEQAAASGPTSAEDHPVARRKNHWTGWQEMYDRFKDRTPYDLWLPEVLEDYCRYGIRPRADGEDYELACPPASEASVYMSSLNRPIFDLVEKVTCPVTVLRAKSRDPNATRDTMDFSLSPTWAGLAAKFQKGRDVYLPHYSHFIPMQDPEFIARCIDEGEEGFPPE